MFGSNVLDIGIGLVLTYLFLSLVVTAANELWATALRSRAIDLERGIRNLLDGTSNLPSSLWKKRFGTQVEPGSLSKDFFEHPLINALSKDNEMPCYIPSQTFASVLVDLIRRSASVNANADPTIEAAEQFAQTSQAISDRANLALKSAQAALDTAEQALRSADANSLNVAQTAVDTAHAKVIEANDAATSRLAQAASARDTLNNLTARPIRFNELRLAIETCKYSDEIKKALSALLEQARCDVSSGVNDLKKLSAQIETWFDHVMDRVSGWYIRRTKWFLFFISLVITTAMNVDTVAICRRLGKDDTLRASVVESAKQFAAHASKDGVKPPGGQAANDFSEALKNVQSEIGRLNSLGIPLGWCYDPIPCDGEVKCAKRAAIDAAAKKRAAKKKLVEADAAAKINGDDVGKQTDFVTASLESQVADSHASNASRKFEQLLTKRIEGHPVLREDNLYDVLNGGWWFLWTKVCGLLLTAFAASLGAPFWFDVLNKFISVRGAGKAPEEKPKDPKVPPPAGAAGG